LTAVPPDYMVEARLAFQRMGADVVPFLIDKLKHSPEQKERRYVAEALGWIGPEAKAAVPTLVQALNEERSRFGELFWPYWQPFAEALVKIDANAPKQAGLE